MQPTPYTPTTDFSQQEANNASGRSTVNTAALDAEFANIEQTLDQTLDNLSLLQRDDGRLKDLSVEIHTISAEVLNLMGGFKIRGLWTPDTPYSAKDIASSGAYTYVCNTSHTSGSDFDDQYWTQFGFTSGADAAQAAANAQMYAAQALSSKMAADADAAATEEDRLAVASDKATVASDKATVASDKSSAQTAATNAANSAAAAAASASALPNANTAGPNKFLKTNSTGTDWEYQNSTQARASLGSTTVGDAVFTAATAAQARTALGSTSVGDSVFTAASAAQARASIASAPVSGLFYKADPTTVAFVKTGAGAASIKAGTKIGVGSAEITYASDTAISMPSLTAGTDYAIWVKDDATIQATTNFTSAPGAGNWRKIGGFHYAPGGNATAQAGGDTTPAINQYSFWDLKFRPACPDPRGMTLVADSFWSDIYLLGVDHLTNGTSKYNVTIADKQTPPKIPIKFGGTGSNAYSTLTWWDANEVLRSWGKRSPTYDEFAALAYGTTEAISSGGTDVPTTGVNGTSATNAWNKFTSAWGVIQSTGCMWIFGANFGGGAAGTIYSSNGRGSSSQMENISAFGGYYASSSEAGSRCSNWQNTASSNNTGYSARGISDHMVID